VLDLPNRETRKLVATQWLTASGLTLRQVMVVVHQRSQDSLASNKSITRITFKRTWDKLNKKTQLREPLKLQLKSKPQFKITNFNNQWWWSSTHTTKISTTTTKFNNHNSKATWASTKPTKWCSNSHFQLSQTSGMPTTPSSSHSSQPNQFADLIIYNVTIYKTKIK